MKVCHVVPTLEMPAGGIEELLWNLLPRLKEHGVESHVLSLDGDGELGNRFADCGATVSSVSKSSAIDFGALRAIVRELESIDADIVHLHQRWIPLRFVLHYLVDVSVVVTYHNVYNPEIRADSISRRMKMRLENSVNELCDSSIFVSEAVQRTHHPNGMPQNSRVIYAGVDFSDISKSTSDEPTGSFGAIDSEQPVVATLARFVPQKGIGNLIRAFASITEQTDSVLVLGGDGELREEFESLVTRLNIEDRVQFVGYVENQYDFYAKADVFVVPSRFEGLPVTLIEVCASGVPVVASDITPLREVLEDTPAPLVQPGDTGRFAEEILRMLDDDDYRESVASSVRKTAQSKFDIETMVQEHVDVYRSVTASQSETERSRKP